MHYCELYISGVVQDLCRLCTSQYCFTCAHQWLETESGLWTCTVSLCVWRRQSELSTALKDIRKAAASTQKWNTKHIIKRIIKKAFREVYRKCSKSQPNCSFPSNLEAWQRENWHKKWLLLLKKRCNNRSPTSDHTMDTQWTAQLRYSFFFFFWERFAWCHWPVFAQYLNWWLKITQKAFFDQELFKWFCPLCLPDKDFCNLFTVQNIKGTVKSFPLAVVLIYV